VITAEAAERTAPEPGAFCPQQNHTSSRPPRCQDGHMADILRFPRHRDPGPDREPDPLWRDVLGPRLRSTREEQGERLVDVAEKAGISPQYLSEIERGRKDPSSEVLSAVSGALGLTVLALAERSAKRLGEGPRGPVCLAA
jgi:DNA-binding XRE family transcriptional regulator